MSQYYRYPKGNGGYVGANGGGFAFYIAAVFLTTMNINIIPPISLHSHITKFPRTTTNIVLINSSR